MQLDEFTKEIKKILAKLIKGIQNRPNILNKREIVTDLTTLSERCTEKFLNLQFANILNIIQ